MMRSTRSPLGLAALVAAGALLPTLAAAGPVRPAYRTAPSAAPAREIARAYVVADAARLGAGAVDFAEIAVTDEVRTARNGVTHVYLRQTVNGLQVDGAELGVHVDRAGRVFHVTGRPVAALTQRAAESRSFPLLTPEEAIEAAVRAVGLGTVERLDLLEVGGGAERAAVLANAAISELPIPVRLRYFRVPDSDLLRLAWNLSIKNPSGAQWWDFWVDAESGAVLGRHDWTTDASYRVFASPKESPNDGP
ncbi:MAG: hypothetical protein F9K18_13470, partial [Thermoanaerobaculia bacterium]